MSALRSCAKRVSSLVAATLIVATVMTAQSQPAEAIINGQIVTDRNQYPEVGLLHDNSFDWSQPQMGREGSHCTAVLIDPNWAATAGHCFKVVGSPAKEFDLIFRISDRNQRNDSQAIRRDYEVFHHEDENVDFALLKLSRPVTEIPSVRLALPHESNLYSTGSVRPVFGWGKNESGYLSHELRTTTQKVVDRNPIDRPNRLLTTAAPGPQGAPSNGDSGGPLYGSRNVVGGILQGSGNPETTYQWIDPAKPAVLDWTRRTMGLPPYQYPTGPNPGPVTPPTAPAPAPQAPAAPTALNASDVQATSVRLSWSGSAGANGYRAYNADTGAEVGSTTGTSLTVGGLASNTQYRYLVRAYNNVGSSAASNTVTIRTLSYLHAGVSQAAFNSAGQLISDASHMRPGERVRLNFTVRNTGTATWLNHGPNPVLLGTDRSQDRHSWFQDPTWINHARPALLRESRVEPGQTGSFEFWVTAPDTRVVLDEYFRPVAEGITWFNDIGIYSKLGSAPVVGIAGSAQRGEAHWTVAVDGGVFSYGAPFYGSAAGLQLNGGAVDIVSSRSGNGYYVVASDGGVFAYGDAPFYGGKGGQHLNAPIVGMAITPSGNGYWLVGADGGIFTFGDAGFAGSMGGQHINAPVVSMAASKNGSGYWLIGRDGGVFAFGSALFHGSMSGRPLNGPVVGVSASPSGYGYRLAASDGGVFAFGDASYTGNATGLGQRITAVDSTANGYVLTSSAGTTQPYVPIRDRLLAGEVLPRDIWLVSENRRYGLVLQGDGNLVLYENGVARWASGSYAPGGRAIMQTDGNLVIYTHDNRPVWASGTRGNGVWLLLQNDRNLVMYTSSNQSIWASNSRA